MSKALRTFQAYCQKEPLFCGVLLYVLLAFAPGLCGNLPLWLMCVVRYLLPAALAAVAAVACFYVPAAALGARGLQKSFLLSAPVVVFVMVNILAGAFSLKESAVSAAFAGVCEEFLCRLMLYPAIRLHFQGRKHGEEAAILLSSLLFGVAHLSNLGGDAGIFAVLFQCCYTTLIGIVFANGYRRSGCIWGSVVWHVLLNLSGTLFG